MGKHGVFPDGEVFEATQGAHTVEDIARNMGVPCSPAFKRRISWLVHREGRLHPRFYPRADA